MKMGYKTMLRARLLVKSTFQIDLKWLVMRPTAPENFDGYATTDQLDPTWKAQVDLFDPTRRSIWYTCFVIRSWWSFVGICRVNTNSYPRLVLLWVQNWNLVVYWGTDELWTHCWYSCRWCLRMTVIGCFVEWTDFVSATSHIIWNEHHWPHVIQVIRSH